MKGVFLSYIASFGVVVLMAIALPALNARRQDMPRATSNRRPVAPPVFAAGPPVDFPRPAVPPLSRPRFAPPPGVQPLAMTNSITLIVLGSPTCRPAKPSVLS